jgi:hypothetical protein
MVASTFSTGTPAPLARYFFVIYRVDGDSLVVQTQPAHSWISGQLARHWGNQYFGRFAPAEEVCLAAALHDIGFAQWERAPTLNPETRRPYSFSELPARVHFQLWSNGVEQMLGFGFYPALLVSLHYSRICQRHFQAPTTEEGRLKAKFLDEQKQIQEDLLSALRQDPSYQTSVNRENLHRNHDLITLWDWISLILMLDDQPEITLDQVPDSRSRASIRLRRKSRGHLILEPWPFWSPFVHLVTEIRRIPLSFKNELQMQRAIKEADPVACRFSMTPT